MDDISALERGPLYDFGDWPVEACPRVAAGVYTIWRGPEFVYVGMAGRGKSAADIERIRAGGKSTGLWERLGSHASGRRSGDQFCVYVADRLVLGELSHEEIDRVASGELMFDTLVRDFVRSKLAFRFVEAPDGRSALEAERRVQAGALSAGRPLLNPI